MRRLPVYFLLDTSGSMFGEPIQALNNGLNSMVNTLRSDAISLEILWISIITFGKEAIELSSLTELPSFQLQEINCPQIGPTNTGKALELLYEKINKEFIKVFIYLGISFRAFSIGSSSSLAFFWKYKSSPTLESRNLLDSQ